MLQKVYAADQVAETVVNPLNRFQNLGDIFGFVVNLIIGIGWSLVLVMLAVGFIQYVLSRGDKVGTENAQKTITYAIVGGIGLLLIMALRTILFGILGTNQAAINATGGNLDIVPLTP